MLVFTALLLAVPACLASRLPIVDLGYELHQASSYDVGLSMQTVVSVNQEKTNVANS